MEITKSMLRQGMQGRIRIGEIVKANKLNEDFKKSKEDKKEKVNFNISSKSDNKENVFKPKKIRLNGRYL
jgi:hypothetical protein